MRNKNISPALSGKSSPNFSGHNSPCPTIEENKLSVLSPSKIKPSRSGNFEFAGRSPRPHFFDSPSKDKDYREKQFERMLKDSYEQQEICETGNLNRPKSMSLENLKEMINSSGDGYDFFNRSETSRNGKLVFDNSTQTEGLIEDSLTWLDYLIKYCGYKVEENPENNDNTANSSEIIENCVENKSKMRDWNLEIEEELENERKIEEELSQKLGDAAEIVNVVENFEPVPVNTVQTSEVTSEKLEETPKEESQEVAHIQESNEKEDSSEISKDSEKTDDQPEISNLKEKTSSEPQLSNEKDSKSVESTENKENLKANENTTSEVTIIDASNTWSEKLRNSGSKPEFSAPQKPANNQTKFTKPVMRSSIMSVRQTYSLRNQTIPSVTKKPIQNNQLPTKRPSFSAPTQIKARTTLYNKDRNNIPTSNNSGANNKSSVLTKNQSNQNLDKNAKNSNNFSVRSKTMIEIPNNKHKKSSLVNSNQNLEELPARKISKEESDSSTSTLKASTEKLGSKNSVIERNVKQKPNAKLENDGWLTVKTKRRSSLHWSTRFDQPSGSASLPSLTLLNENENENGEENCGNCKELNKKCASCVEKSQKSSQKCKNCQIELSPSSSSSDLCKNCENSQSKQKVNDRKVKSKIEPRTTSKNSSTTLQKSKTTLANSSSSAKNRAQQQATNKTMKTNNGNQATGNKSQEKINRPASGAANSNTSASRNLKDNVIMRQKSDLTGLKIKSLRKEYLRSSGQSRNQKLKNNSNKHNKVEETGDENQIDKVDMYIQTTMISHTFINLYNECLSEDNKDENKLMYQNGELSSCDELEEKEETESDDDQKKLLEEQESLERQIRELENTGEFKCSFKLNYF